MDMNSGRIYDVPNEMSEEEARKQKLRMLTELEHRALAHLSPEERLIEIAFLDYLKNELKTAMPLKSQLHKAFQAGWEARNNAKQDA